MPDTTESKQILNVKELAAVLAVHPDTIHKWVRRGIIPRMKFGRVVRFELRKVLDALVEQR
jgi:excisionase family DNA binding protein